MNFTYTPKQFKLQSVELTDVLQHKSGLYIVIDIVVEGQDYIIMDLGSGDKSKLIIGINSKDFTLFEGTITIG